MKKIVTLILISTLGGVITLTSYKLFFEANDTDKLVETKALTSSVSVATTPVNS